METLFGGRPLTGPEISLGTKKRKMRDEERMRGGLSWRKYES